MQESFEKEFRNLFDRELLEKTKKLKKSRNIFNPLFYILFTRLVELSAIANNIILPNKYELEELFRIRKSFLQLDYGILGETIRRVWIYQRKKGLEYTFSESLEDLLYTLYRMSSIQKKIDELILKYAVWERDALTELYFTIVKILLDLDDELNREIEKELAVSEKKK